MTQVPPVLLPPALPSFSSVRSSSSVNFRPIPQPLSSPAPAISSLASWAAHMVLSHPPPPQQPSQRPFNVQRRAAGAARPSLAPAAASRGSYRGRSYTQHRSLPRPPQSPSFRSRVLAPRCNLNDQARQPGRRLPRHRTRIIIVRKSVTKRPLEATSQPTKARKTREPVENAAPTPAASTAALNFVKAPVISCILTAFFSTRRPRSQAQTARSLPKSWTSQWPCVAIRGTAVALWQPSAPLALWIAPRRHARDAPLSDVRAGIRGCKGAAQGRGVHARAGASQPDAMVCGACAVGSRSTCLTPELLRAGPRAVRCSGMSQKEVQGMSVQGNQIRSTSRESDVRGVRHHIDFGIT